MHQLTVRPRYIKQLRSQLTIGAIAGLCVIAGSVGLGSSPVSAQTPSLPAGSISHEIHITARVLPMRHVIVDASGQILKITSNTTEDVPPVAYLGNDLSAQQIPLSPAIRAEYLRHLSDVAQSSSTGHSSLIGVLYQRGPVAAIVPAVLGISSPLNARG